MIFQDNTFPLRKRVRHFNANWQVSSQSTDDRQEQFTSARTCSKAGIL